METKKSGSPDHQLVTSVKFSFSFHSRTKREGVDVHSAAECFAKNWAMGFLDKLLTMVQDHNAKKYVSPRTLTFCLKVVTNCISIKQCQDTMKGYLAKIMLDYCVPLLALNQKDFDYWKDDPIQFIYSESNKTDDHNMLKNAAEELIKKIADIRIGEPKPVPLMYNLKDFVFTCLEKMENPYTGERLTPLNKEYLLRAIHCTTDVYKLDRVIRNDLEPFTVRHLLPELMGDCDVLKFRCLSLYSQIGFFFNFKDKASCEQACQGVSACMASPLLPVRMAAAEAMCVLLRNSDARLIMKDYLEKMLQIILEMLNEVDYDGLIHSLEAIIENYENDIGSQASKLIEGLGVAYYKYKSNLNAGKGQQTEEEDVAGESERAASACLETMANLLKTNLSQNLYVDCIEPILKILNITILENDEVDFQNALTLLNLLVYKNNQIDDTLAFYFPIMCYFIIGRPSGNMTMDISNFNEQLQDVLAQVNSKPQWYEDVGMITACMMNFFQKCGDSFLQMNDCFGNNFVDLTFKVVQELIQQSLNQMNAHCLQFGVKLLIGLMENFRGKIDDRMGTILGMVGELLDINTNTNTIIGWLLSVVSVALWYNPELTFKVANQRTIEGWFESFNLMTSEQDRERKLSALSHILLARSDTLPNFIRMGPLMNEIFKTSSLLVEAKKCDNDQDEDYDDSYNSEYSQYYEDDDDAWSEDEDFEEEFENLYYDSPLLAQCSVVNLKSVLEQIEKSNQQYFQELIGYLSKDDQPKFAQLLNEAERLFAKSASNSVVR